MGRERWYRYAIYFTPEEKTPLYAMGSRWLGRDAATGLAASPGLSDGIGHEEWREATESPRRYGFHATLKPPFQLADGRSPEELGESLRHFAASHKAFSSIRPMVGALGRFLALIPAGPYPELCQLAAAAVEHFEEFRAPSSPEDLARRRHPGLSARECENLERWGYPYVLDTWKFHMSLTSSLDEEPRRRFHRYLNQLFASPCEAPLPVTSIRLFAEREPNSDFCLIERAPLGEKNS